MIEKYTFVCKFCGRRRRVTFNQEFEAEEKGIEEASKSIGWWIVLEHPWREEINAFAFCPECKKALEKKGTVRLK